MPAADSHSDGGPQLVDNIHNLSISDQGEDSSKNDNGIASGNHGGVCVVCLNDIVLQEIALIKGCEHAYCVTCILRWASYKEKTTCPLCKLPFEFLNVHRALDCSIHDYMFEESVRLLLRASWFEPLTIQDCNDKLDRHEDYFPYEYESYYHNTSLRNGIRNWRDNCNPQRVFWRNIQESRGASSSFRHAELARWPSHRRARRRSLELRPPCRIGGRRPPSPTSLSSHN